eukprot:CAMPEP_0203809756 /NCGR_PEP_ID=MMETSP0115-20131106/2506_1 /ASSEMBLY_ACC=CAM_ASM_000227 /TAXON_ID=33651 /ORGANISM="Bicosoecid sp, Strain ms1" /LENGTH=588 /DNA_ID=CAMNT_0050718513 /DNA_START=37 /DNA_END=1803 /DNA_ORIENTATION=-
MAVARRPVIVVLAVALLAGAANAQGGPRLIDGDAALAAAASSGDGTAASPYRLTNLFLKPGSDGTPCLTVHGTTAYAVIDNSACDGTLAPPSAGVAATGVVLDNVANLKLSQFTVRMLVGAHGSAGNATGAVALVLRDVSNVALDRAFIDTLSAGDCSPPAGPEGPPGGAGGSVYGMLVLGKSDQVLIGNSRFFQLHAGAPCANGYGGRGGDGGSAYAVAIGNGASVGSLQVVNTTVEAVHARDGADGAAAKFGDASSHGGHGGSACGLCVAVDTPSLPKLASTGSVQLASVSVHASAFSALYGGAGGAGGVASPASGKGGRGGDAHGVALTADDSSVQAVVASAAIYGCTFNGVYAGNSGAGGAIDAGGDAGGKAADGADASAVEIACDMYATASQGHAVVYNTNVTSIYGGAGGVGGDGGSDAGQGEAGDGGDGGDAKPIKIESCKAVTVQTSHVTQVYAGHGSVGGASAGSPGDGGSGGDVRAISVSNADIVAVPDSVALDHLFAGSGGKGGEHRGSEAGGADGGDGGDAIGVYLLDDCKADASACEIGFTTAKALYAGSAGDGGAPDGDDGDAGSEHNVYTFNN